MTRTLRKAHLVAWLTIAPVLLIVLVVALRARIPAETSALNAPASKFNHALEGGR